MDFDPGNISVVVVVIVMLPRPNFSIFFEESETIFVAGYMNHSQIQNGGEN